MRAILLFFVCLFPALAGAQVHYIGLNWTASSTPGVSSYNVYRGTVSGGPYSLIGSSSTTSYNDTTYAVGVAEFYVVTAVLNGVESSYSGEATATDSNMPSNVGMGGNVSIKGSVVVH